MKLKAKVEKEEYKPLNIEQIDVSLVQEESEEFLYSARSTPLFKVLDTLLMLGDVFSNSHRSEEALKIFDFISAGYL